MPIQNWANKDQTLVICFTNIVKYLLASKSRTKSDCVEKNFDEIFLRLIYLLYSRSIALLIDKKTKLYFLLQSWFKCNNILLLQAHHSIYCCLPNKRIFAKNNIHKSNFINNKKLWNVFHTFWSKATSHKPYIHFIMLARDYNLV